MSADSLLLTVRDAARELGVGRDFCYELVHTGRLRTIRVGRVIRIPRAELAAFVAREAKCEAEG